MRLTFQICLTAGLCGMMVSCTGFPRGWATAKSSPPADALSGAWVGTWRSDANGHTGGLRAVVAPVAGQPDTWRFRYRASWKRVLCAGFTVDCRGSRRPDGTWNVTGSRDLGRAFGGVFTHAATVSGDAFEACYDSKLDRGTMSLQRVRP